MPLKTRDISAALAFLVVAGGLVTTYLNISAAYYVARLGIGVLIVLWCVGVGLAAALAKDRPIALRRGVALVALAGAIGAALLIWHSPSPRAKRLVRFSVLLIDRSVGYPWEDCAGSVSVVPRSNLGAIESTELVKLTECSSVPANAAAPLSPGAYDVQTTVPDVDLDAPPILVDASSPAAIQIRLKRRVYDVEITTVKDPRFVASLQSGNDVKPLRLDRSGLTVVPNLPRGDYLVQSAETRDYFAHRMPLTLPLADAKPVLFTPALKPRQPPPPGPPEPPAPRDPSDLTSEVSAQHLEQYRTLAHECCRESHDDARVAAACLADALRENSPRLLRTHQAWVAGWIRTLQTRGCKENLR